MFLKTGVYIFKPSYVCHAAAIVTIYENNWILVNDLTAHSRIVKNMTKQYKLSIMTMQHNL